MSLYLGYHLGRLSEIRAPPHGVRLGEVVFDQPQADVVPHPVQLLVNLEVVAIVVFAELGDDGAVCQGDEFCVDFVDSRPADGDGVRSVTRLDAVTLGGRFSSLTSRSWEVKGQLLILV